MARRVVPLAACPAAVAALRAPLGLLCAPLGPLLRPLLGAQGVVPILGPGRGPLALDGLGARGRLRHLRPHSPRSARWRWRRLPHAAHPATGPPTRRASRRGVRRATFPRADRPVGASAAAARRPGSSPRARPSARRAAPRPRRAGGRSRDGHISAPPNKLLCGFDCTANHKHRMLWGKGGVRSARPVADSSGRGTTALRARAGGAMAGHFLSRLWRKREPQVPTGEDVPSAVQPLGPSHATPPTAVSSVLHPWPRLSESLTGPTQPGVCQSCGATNVQLVPSADPNNEMSPIAVDDSSALHARLRRVLVLQRHFPFGAVQHL